MTTLHYFTLQAAQRCAKVATKSTSKKGVAGFGDSNQQAALSRDTALVSGFFICAPSFGGSDGRSQDLPVQGLRLLPGSPTRSSCLPRLATGVAVVQSSNWRPHMANSLTPKTGTTPAANIPRYTTPATLHSDRLALIQRADNALSMARWHLRKQSSPETIRLATGKAVSAARALKQACEGVANHG